METPNIIEEEVIDKPKRKTKKWKTIKCKVVFDYKDTIVVNFNNSMISFKNSKFHNGDIIEVQYTGSGKDLEIKLK